MKKTDWSLKRWVGSTRGDMNPVPLLLEFVEHGVSSSRTQRIHPSCNAKQSPHTEDPRC